MQRKSSVLGNVEKELNNFRRNNIFSWILAQKPEGERSMSPMEKHEERGTLHLGTGDV